MGRAAARPGLAALAALCLGGLLAACAAGPPPAMPRVAAPEPPEAKAALVGGFAWRPLDIAFPVAKRRPDDVAVVIGNADYRSWGRDIPNVVPAYADAESFFRYAVATLGVRARNVISLRDATSGELARVFGTEGEPRGQLADWVKPGTDVTVYYAGHGAPGPKGREAYLVPVDAEAARIALTGYPLGRLYANLSKLPARRVTVVLEACFSGLSQGGTVIPAASGITVTARTPRVPPRITVIAAGGPDQIASWSEDRTSGLFTRHFLTAAAGAADRPPGGDGDGRVGLDEIRRYLDEHLTDEARRLYGRDQTARIVAGEGSGPGFPAPPPPAAAGPAPTSR